LIIFIHECFDRFSDRFNGEFKGEFSDRFKYKYYICIIMRIYRDKTSEKMLKILNKSDSPLETKEIEIILKDCTRTKILYRLNNLRGDGLIKGKSIGSGKGTWIWWGVKK